MLWETFSWAALGPVVVVEQTMKAANCLNIIADQLHPYITFVFPTGNGIFQQDNASCHKARIVLEWFEQHTDEFHLMSWPPNSPDLNPKEHIWDVMEWQLRANLGIGNNFVFYQDNDPKYTALNIRLWYLYNCPQNLKKPESPDLNPIEHILRELEVRVLKHDIKTKSELQTVMLEEWMDVDAEITKKTDEIYSQTFKSCCGC
ncbi:hypothetical protein AVEN_54083-1 [Araneus ventricosus]|uniref:Tc1-like transposase DDE domain-containing protein n=1 Tax=Araneus ventricosus TaxID=182803 RepID=A0A4Y2ICZ0_ARAVE|nr:hypothetical protein AVEN_54083-1 [Araneus ventricosus]